MDDGGTTSIFNCKRDILIAPGQWLMRYVPVFWSSELPIMRLPSRQIVHRSLLVLFVLAAIALQVLVFWPWQKVTKHNFEKIRLGMSRDELHQLLGSPDYQVVEIGIVKDPNTYAIKGWFDAEKKQRLGYQEYQREHWTSSEIDIAAISDFEGRVVCRYTGPGWDWQTSFWSWLGWSFGTAQPLPARAIIPPGASTDPGGDLVDQPGRPSL
jgi:hypothetical protein